MGLTLHAGPRWPALPVEYIVETTAKCNLYCPMCPRETHKQPKADMPDDVFERLVRESGSTAEHMMLIGLGEPFMDKQIFERIEFCHRHSISALLSTNGTFLDERNAGRVLDSPLDQITLSFDGAKKETFEFYRKGANFEKVRDNFVRFSRLKHERRSKLQVVVQMVCMAGNAGEVDDFLAFWSAVPGVDQVRIKQDETNVIGPAGHAAEDWKIPLPLPLARPGLREAEWRRPTHAARAICWTGRRSATSPRSRCLRFGTPSRCSTCGVLHAGGRGGEVDICAALL